MLSIRNSSGERLDISFHDAEKSDCLVILGHGVTGNKDRPLLVEIAKVLAENGWPSLRVSFSGNGDSEGSFTKSHITKEVSDLTSVIDQLGKGKRIAYIGHSMGGAVGALTAARDERIKVLVSLAGMVDTGGFVTREFGDVTPDEGCMWDEPSCPLSQAYVDDLKQIGDTRTVASELHLPWLLIHSKDDDVVLPTDSQNLLKVLRGPSRLIEIEGAGHSFEGHHNQLAAEVCDWLEKYL
ncbi:MAG: alpha/beta hydrolase family protein [Akkermansiaceae bacterium]